MSSLNLRSMLRSTAAASAVLAVETCPNHDARAQR